MKILKNWKKTLVVTMAAVMLTGSFAIPVMAHGGHHNSSGSGHHGDTYCASQDKANCDGTYCTSKNKTKSDGVYCPYHEKTHKKKSNCKKYCAKHKTTHKSGKRHHSSKNQ